VLFRSAAQREIDLKLLAKSLGFPKQKFRMATLREAESLTGLQVGGISPLVLLNRGFEICADAPVLNLAEIHISAGQRGIDLKLAVKDLMAVTRAKIVHATREEEGTADGSRSSN
jgi:Cys-tRNA(Pro)/Cys-tRNA(Cys) deacylase